MSEYDETGEEEAYGDDGDSDPTILPNAPVPNSTTASSPPASASLPSDSAEDEDPEIAEMKRRLAELEDENSKIAALSASSGSSPAAASASSSDTDSRSVYVGNVDYSSTKEELRSLFSSCGPVLRVTIMTDKQSGQPKGFAYIEFAERSTVHNATLLNETEFKGRQLKVIPKRTNIPQHQLIRGRGRVRQTVQHCIACVALCWRCQSLVADCRAASALCRVEVEDEAAEARTVVAAVTTAATRRCEAEVVTEANQPATRRTDATLLLSHTVQHLYKPAACSSTPHPSTSTDFLRPMAGRPLQNNDRYDSIEQSMYVRPHKSTSTACRDSLDGSVKRRIQTVRRHQLVLHCQSSHRVVCAVCLTLALLSWPQTAAQFPSSASR